ncbi:hypothetical protein MH117_05150 [Paenibacillus sp. ACRRX]|uniref:DUF6731 family protein n=1 Tax=Paenibacillus sp. ACRRX TaxID=2918206 RepID=UPI001EF3E009|nr:DUF6731 family protein [Paenibacillus sp. ACRRX]MCG7406798.1 hypothetical protein [Paenibacillus sp. ACRRX]
MSRRFHYFNVFITKNGNATTLQFSDFIEQVLLINWANRIRKINLHPTSLFEVAVPVVDQTCRVAAIGKYRQQVKPYIGDINTDTAKMINNDIIEMVTLVVAPMTRTVLVEFNFYGCKVKDIEAYFNSFFATNDQNEQWGVIFTPVNSDRSIENIRASNDIRDVSLKMNTSISSFEKLLATSQEPNRRNTLFGKLLNLIKDIEENTDAPIVNLSFGKGRKRKIDLDAGEILKLIELLDIDNNESVQSCRVEYKNISTGKYEPLELKNVGIRSDVILENDNGNPGWDFVGDKILEKYIEKKRPGSASRLDGKISYVKAKLPDLIEEPREEHAVPVQEGQRRDLQEDNLLALHD